MRERRYAPLGVTTDHESRLATLEGAGGGATQLSELSDVNTSTATNRNVLVADGVDFESRALVEADISDLQAYLTAETNDLTAAVTWTNVPNANITQASVTQHQAALSITESQISDLGTYLTDVVGDTTPQLGGNLDTNSNDISGAGTIDMAPNARSVTATGNTATTDYSKVIRFTSGSGQTFTLDADPPTNAVIMLDNSSGNSWTIAASVSLIWAKDATTGNRTLADDGIAVALHRGSGTWIINGSDLLT